MDWLSPMTGLIAAAVAVPALVLLYFLKLKRRDMPVSSTLLWKRAVQDLQVNAPLQRLRRNILLVLQLAALAALLAALARPVLLSAAGPAMRHVILIDRSRSMSASDVGPTRLEEAKRQARALVDSLRAKRTWYFTDESDQAMVIAFDSGAKVLSNFTSDKGQLKAAIGAIEPTDGRSRLGEALLVARAFATPAGADTNNRTAQAPARLELLSDGRIADLDRVVVGPGEVVYHAVGKSSDNVGVVAMQARRSYEQPDKLNVFADLANYGAAAVSCDVQLAVGGTVRAVRAVDVPPRGEPERGRPGKPGHAAVSFLMTYPEGGVVEVRAAHADALAADNAAWAVITPPRRLSGLLVTAGNDPLRSALRAVPLARLDVCTPAEFDAMDFETMSVARPYGLIVLDRHAPPRLPRAGYLVFGDPPAESGASAGKDLKNQVIVDWQAKHPAMTFVNLENFFAARCRELRLPRDAVVLAEFGQSPALALVRRGGGVFLLAGFDLLETNWPFDPGLVMFLQNVVTFFGSEAAGDEGAGLEVGQPITLARRAGAAEGVLSGPGIAGERLAADPSGRFRYARTTRAGVYRLAVEGEPEACFAVNLLDADESDIRPAAELAFTGQVVEAERSEPGRANREVWPLLVALGLVFVLIEWYVYAAKVRI